MNDRCGCVRAHGYDLTGKMTGGGLHSVAWASAITLDSTSVIALVLRQGRSSAGEGKLPRAGRGSGNHRGRVSRRQFLSVCTGTVRYS